MHSIRLFNNSAEGDWPRPCAKALPHGEQNTCCEKSAKDSQQAANQTSPYHGEQVSHGFNCCLAESRRRYAWGERPERSAPAGYAAGTTSAPGSASARTAARRSRRRRVRGRYAVRSNAGCETAYRPRTRMSKPRRTLTWRRGRTPNASDQLPGRLQGLYAAERRNAGPVNCIRWLGDLFFP